MSLSAWLREAGRQKLASEREARLPLTPEALARFFRECDRREEGVEPSWDEHLGILERSRRSGSSGS
jgi:hypothetical protein